MCDSMHETRAFLVLAEVTSLLGYFTSSLTHGKDPGLLPLNVTLHIVLTSIHKLCAHKSEIPQHEW